MKQTATTITMPEYESTPKSILSTTKLICNWLGRYYRAVETKDFIYFCNYQESDENASVKMYRKSDLSLTNIRLIFLAKLEYKKTRNKEYR